MASEMLKLTVEMDHLLQVIPNNLGSVKHRDEVLMALDRARSVQNKLRRLTGGGVNACPACGRPF